jgi:hypothetical protein
MLGWAMVSPVTEYRASFDADLTFSDGGGLQARGFRLDVPGPDVTEDELASRFVRHLEAAARRLAEAGARLHAAPPRVRGFSSFPVRAYAVVPGWCPAPEIR